MSYVATFALMLHLNSQINKNLTNFKAQPFPMPEGSPARAAIEALTPERLKEGAAWVNNHFSDKVSWTDVEVEPILGDSKGEIPAWGTNRCLFRVKREHGYPAILVDVSESEDGKLHLHSLDVEFGGEGSIRVHRGISVRLSDEGYALKVSLRQARKDMKDLIASVIQSMEALHWKFGHDCQFVEPSQDLVSLLIYSMRND